VFILRIEDTDRTLDRRYIESIMVGIVAQSTGTRPGNRQFGHDMPKAVKGKAYCYCSPEELDRDGRRHSHRDDHKNTTEGAGI
jgi:glutamyl/glutaminyl-tRNA synthetase